jgi:hypothetical protein
VHEAIDHDTMILTPLLLLLLVMLQLFVTSSATGYLPDIKRPIISCSEKYPCRECEGMCRPLTAVVWYDTNMSTHPFHSHLFTGDCDNDYQCKDSLVCVQRTMAETTHGHVPGCLGTDYSRTGKRSVSSYRIPFVF